MNYKTIADDLRAERDELQDQVSQLEGENEKLEDKVSSLEADLHAMRASRDTLMSWVKTVIEEEYSWSAIRISGLRVLKESREEEERPELHRKGRL